MNSFNDYGEARRDAQRQANVYRRDVGIEAATEYGRRVYRLHLLPKPSHRQGFELRCEVVSPEPDECHSCNRSEERTETGVRKIELDEHGFCAACRDAADEMR